MPPRPALAAEHRKRRGPDADFDSDPEFQGDPELQGDSEFECDSEFEGDSEFEVASDRLAQVPQFEKSKIFFGGYG